MSFFRTASSLLVLLFLTGAFAHAQDNQSLAPLDGYKPPPKMFDDNEEPDNLPEYMNGSASAPSLTSFDADKPPVPPRKPKPPKKEALLSKPIKARALEPFNPRKSLKKKKLSRGPTKIIAPKNPGVKKPQKPKVKQAKLKDIDSEQLVEPSARDILASIAGSQTKAESSGKMSLVFKAGETLLTSNMKTTIINDYVPRLRDGGGQKIEIQAFASAGTEGESGARRISLARAMEVKDFLIEKGVDSARIDIRPLGSQPKSGKPDRIDIVLP